MKLYLLYEPYQRGEIITNFEIAQIMNQPINPSGKRLYRNDVSAVTREKQSQAHTGRKLTQDTKQKISKSMTDYWAKLPYKPVTDSDIYGTSD